MREDGLPARATVFPYVAAKLSLIVRRDEELIAPIFVEIREEGRVLEATRVAIDILDLPGVIAALSW